MEFTLRTSLLTLLAVAAALPLYEGSPQQVSQRPSVIVPVGGMAILPVKLNGTLDRNGVKVEWRHGTKYVHVFENNKPYLGYQDGAYRNRAFLFEDQISEGIFSLTLINVTEQDAGIYTCVIFRDKKAQNGENFEFYLNPVPGSPYKGPLGGPKPDPTPTPSPNQDWIGTVAGVAGVAGVLTVVVIIVIAGLFYKRRGNGNY